MLLPGERERDAVFTVAADQRELRARGLHRTAEEQRAAPRFLRRLRLLHRLGARRARAHARLDIEARLRRDDASTAVGTKLVSLFDPRRAFRARHAIGVAVDRDRLRRRSTLVRARTWIEGHGCPATLTLRHPDRGQRAARV